MRQAAKVMTANRGAARHEPKFHLATSPADRSNVKSNELPLQRRQPQQETGRRPSPEAPLSSAAWQRVRVANIRTTNTFSDMFR